MKEDEINLKVGKEALANAKKKANIESARNLPDIQYVDSRVLNMNFDNQRPITKDIKRKAELNLEMQINPEDRKKAAVEFQVKLSASNPKGELCFKLTLVYIGIFVINNQKGDVQRMLSTTGASILYPYLQHEIKRISDATRCGMSLSYMDFESAYNEHKASEAQDSVEKPQSAGT